MAEWQVHAVDDAPDITAPQPVTTATGTAPTLPTTVSVAYGAESVNVPVIWRPVDPAAYAQAGSFTVQGVVAGVAETSDSNGGLDGNVTIAVDVVDGYQPSGETQRPSVRVALAGVEGNEGWLVTSPVAIVSGSDPGGGVNAKLELKVGAESWQTVAVDANLAAVPVDGQGLVRVHAKATNADGRVSVPESAEVWVDTMAPTVSANVDAGARTMTLSASDGDGSGVAGIEYRIGDGEWAEYAEDDIITASSSARETVTFRAVDVAGNVSVPASADIP